MSLPEFGTAAVDPPDAGSGPRVPSRARIVIIGGGVGGTSIAYHLAKLGERDVVLLDRAELTSGSTFHSAGLVGQLRSDPTLTRMNMYSVELYRELQRSDSPPGWVESGSIRLASSPERLQELRRQLAWARVFSLPMEEISPAGAQQMFPMMSTDGVLGGVYLPSDGQVDPSQLCYSLAARARAGGVTICQHTRVLGLDVLNGRVRRVHTDRGDIEAEVVVNCGGIYAAQIARLAGIRVPIVPMSHQYVVTDPIPAVAALPSGETLPSLRDPDLLVYYRQEGGGLLMGGYERSALPFATDAAHYDAVPADFNARLLPEDWDRFAEIAENSSVRVPAMADARIRRLINGPEAFTPDNEFCLGQTEVDGLFVSAGFCAHGIAGAGGVGKLMAEWIVAGEPTMEVAHMDINRFGRQYSSPSFTLKRVVENYQTYYDIRYPGDEGSAGRRLRRSPVFDWHQNHGAAFGEKSGWERVNFYLTNSDEDFRLRPHGWAGHHFSPAVAVEHRAARESVALFDESSFAKLAVAGPDAATFLEWVCANNVGRGIGRVTYTQLLNRRGGIQADATVTRVGVDSFWLITGTASGSRDGAWLRRQARAGAFNVIITDITGQYACFALWGPRAQDLLGSLTPADMSQSAFGFMTSQELPVDDIPLRAQRVTFVGESGWELYAPVEYGAALWESIWAAGAECGLVAAGYRAIESLRIEKAYRVWGSDVNGETDPLSAGLGFCVAWDKDFLGRDALLAIRDAGPSRKLCCLTLDDPAMVVLGGEPVRMGGELVGRVTSGGFGYTVGGSIAFAYLPVELAGLGSPLHIDLFGEWVSGQVAADILYDPAGVRVRS